MQRTAGGARPMSPHGFQSPVSHACVLPVLCVSGCILVSVSMFLEGKQGTAGGNILMNTLLQTQPHWSCCIRFPINSSWWGAVSVSLQEQELRCGEVAMSMASDHWRLGQDSTQLASTPGSFQTQP